MPKVGFKMSDVSKQKMREAKLRNPVRYWTGKKLSKEHNEKMQAGKRLKSPKPRLGKFFTQASKDKISQTLKKKFASGELVSPLRKLGLIGRKGKDAMNWQGGKSLEGQKIRTSRQYKEFRLEVLQRDDFTCRFCKKRGGKLEVDHIQEVSKRRDLVFDVSNGRTLCKDCHRRVTLGWKPEIDFREDFINAIIKLAETDERVVFVTCDVGFSFLERFREKFPRRFYNFGVTEQSTALICAGLALSGFRPIFYSMINFVLYRPFEMIRNGVGYHNAPVVLAGVQGSVKYKMLGFSHCSKKNEDINLIDDIPNMRVYIPMKHEEIEGMVEKMFSENYPTYIRL